jgi:hypothetical protein
LTECSTNHIKSFLKKVVLTNHSQIISTMSSTLMTPSIDFPKIPIPNQPPSADP